MLCPLLPSANRPSTFRAATQACSTHQTQTLVRLLMIDLTIFQPNPPNLRLQFDAPLDFLLLQTLSLSIATLYPQNRPSLLDNGPSYEFVEDP